ncbi:2Fe-2S iron-sulfur cluster-binding protein [Streptomyces sp. NPDC056045]|uniref:2Fe-2S iron-sulfur cluster-binding protein n=1 Tax=Streptomyces sp. NPDC056045 TaxID=3345691 RepID=UPI0035E04281
MSNEDHNDRHDQHGQQDSLQYGGWQPTPQGGEYDDGATAFVHLPPEDLANIPLAAPGQGFVPPMILPLTPAAGFDPASTDNWVARTPDGQEPGAAPEQQAPEAVHWPDPNQQQSPYGYGYPQFQETQRIPRITETGPAPYAEQDGLTGQAGQAGLPHEQYSESSAAATGQWNFTESAEYGIHPGHVEHGGHGEQGGHVEHGGHNGHGGHVEHGGHTGHTEQFGHTEHGGQYGHTGHTGPAGQTGHTGHTDQFGHVEHDSRPGHGEQPGHGGHDDQSGHGGHGGHTGQWTIPVAEGDLPEESGEFAASALAAQWYGDRTPPATLPGGAPAPWATQRPVPEPAPEPGAGSATGPAPGTGVEPEHAPSAEFAPAPTAMPPAVPAAPVATPPTEPVTSSVTYEDALRASGAVAFPEAAPEPPVVGTAPAQDADSTGAEPAGTDAVRGTPSGEAPATAPDDVPGGHPAEAGPGEPSEAVPETPHAPGPTPPADEAEAAPQARTPEVTEAPGTPEAAETTGAAETGTPEITGAAETGTPETTGAAETGTPETTGAAETGNPGPEAESTPEPGPETAEPAEPAEPAESVEPAAAETAGATEPEPADPATPAAPAEPTDSADRTDPTDPTDPAGLADPAALVEPQPFDVPDERPAVSYVLSVNGTDRPVTDAWIGESLLYVLRERLGLAGAKDGCSQGECGACNVQVDGRLVASCLVPAATTAGSEVRTVEGLAVDGEPSDVQRALAKCGAVQCGFCIPGMAMTVHDLLEGNHAPSELETRKALCGNLCRCSGYRGVLDAVNEVIAGREAAADPAAPDSSFPEADENRVPPRAASGTEEVWSPHAGSPHPGPVPDMSPGAVGDPQPHSQDGGMA